MIGEFGVYGLDDYICFDTKMFICEDDNDPCKLLIFEIL